MRSGEAKGFTNRMLEGNPVPTLWVSNSVRQIDPAFLRRFDYHLEVRVPPRPVRRRILEKHVDGLAVGPAWLERMAGCENLSPADVRGAARVVGLSGLTDRDAVEAALDRVLGNRVAVRGEALAVNQQHEDGLGYRLDYVNATHDLGELAASFERHPRGSILLYGPPGTGKTRWARHLADRLGRPLLVRRASDLLDCWVGNTEKNIARMFREARAEGAVLLLDEADSFLRERGGAVRSWEVTQVNELLTQMESFDGLFVCSTNLVDWLDAASFRRFTFKVRLSYAGPEQAWAMFVALAEDLGVDLGPGRGRLREAVDRLRCLTPGDFATVRRQARLLAGPHDARKLLAALEEECRAKKESGCGRPLGFCG
jgi:SpoVK/Ycf46/Vps4 family AAA+-type ATPase